MSYVVRIDRLEGEPPDFKVFQALPEAKRRFQAASSKVIDGDFSGAFLFEVASEQNPRLAVEAVKSGNAVLMERDPWERMVREIDISLSDMLGRSDDAERP